VNRSAALELARQSECETYRAIVLRQKGRELLLVRADTRFLLPSVEVPRWQRIAESVTAAMKSEWGQEVICLFIPDVAFSANHDNRINYQVAEYCRSVEKPRKPTQWLPISALSEGSFVDWLDYSTVLRSLSECDVNARDLSARAFGSFGWFEQLTKWTGEVIESKGLHLNGKFCQLNASPSFSLVRFETDGPAIWFKAVGKPNLREFPITLALARLFPEHVPQVLATRPDCSGWLALEVQGTNLGETRDTTLWETAAAALGELQIESISKRASLLDTGARDLTVAALSSLVRPFLEVMGQLMEQQSRVPPLALSGKELASLGERIQDALSLAGERGIPITLGHLDLNPGNIIVSPNSCVFLDWAEAYVGYPFFSFEYLLEHFRRAVRDDRALEERLIGSYASQWGQLISPSVVAENLTFAPLLAVFAYAAGSGMWNDQDRLRDPQIAGYLRGLTRRMSREANLLNDRRSPCVG